MTTNETQRAAPKPWPYGTGSEGFPVFDGRDRLIAYCYDYTESDDPAEPHDHAAEANAKLMAAAPQMLAALQEIARLNSREALRAGHVLSVSPNVAALALTAIVGRKEVVGHLARQETPTSQRNAHRAAHPVPSFETADPPTKLERS